MSVRPGIIEGVSTSSWQQTRALFEQCLNLDPAARETRLATATAEVRTEVLELLDFADRESPVQERYVPIAVLDTNGRGLVFSARDDVSGGPVVLKMFRVQSDRVAEARTLLARQVEFAAELPCGVPWLAAGVAADRVAWIVQQPSEAVGLEQFAATTSPSKSRRRALFRRIHAALRTAKEFGLCSHWPVPGQILIGASDHVALTDFGLLAELAVDPGGVVMQPAEALRVGVALLLPELAVPTDAGPERILQLLERDDS